MSKLNIQDAMGIETAFKMLVGLDHDTLDGVLHADVFRQGDPKQIGLLLQKTADVLKERMGHIEFKPEEGRVKSRLGIAINDIRLMGKVMEEMKKYEPNDYRWYIIAMLIQIIASLFDHLEGDTRL